MDACSIETPVDRWKHRRKMAWIAFWAGVTYPLLLLFSMLFGKEAAILSLAGPYFLFLGSVVGAYIGFATADDKWQKQDVRS